MMTDHDMPPVKIMVGEFTGTKPRYRGGTRRYVRDSAGRRYIRVTELLDGGTGDLEIILEEATVHRSLSVS